MILSEQIRAARALLGWEQKTLAEQAGLGLSTIKRLESARGPVGGTAESVWAVQRALEPAGIIFIDGRRQSRPGCAARNTDKGQRRLASKKLLFAARHFAACLYRPERSRAAGLDSLDCLRSKR